MGEDNYLGLGVPIRLGLSDLTLAYSRCELTSSLFTERRVKVEIKITEDVSVTRNDIIRSVVNVIPEACEGYVEVDLIKICQNPEQITSVGYCETSTSERAIGICDLQMFKKIIVASHQKLNTVSGPDRTLWTFEPSDDTQRVVTILCNVLYK